MNRQFIVAVIIGIGALMLFAYFVFGLNGTEKPSDQLYSELQTSEKLQIKDEKIGTGAAVQKGDTIAIHYSGTLPNGEQFDSSYDRGEPFVTEIGTGQVIQGWDEGVVGMKVGGKRKLIIPPSLGYGDQAVGSIPPNATLLFTVELVEIK